MTTNFAINAPLNQVSFGQTTINILREIYRRGLEPPIFPIGEITLQSYSLDAEFTSWLEKCINKSYLVHQRKFPTLKLWHISNSLESLSEKQVLFTFHETDEVTPAEKNIVSNNTKVLFSSAYSKNIFSDFGCNNVSNVPLGFDKDSFFKREKPYDTKNKIYFGLAGKLEKRKHHFKILKLWARKFGNDSRFFLNCALYNHHMHPEVQQGLISQAFEGKRYYNIQFQPFMENNEAYNDYLNSNSIMLGLSGAEGWGLPEFQSVALGKHAVVLNATGYKEWVTEENAVLVQPSGKLPVYDGVFFAKGAPFSQGSIYDFNEENFYAAIDEAINRYIANPVNEAGLALQEKFTWANTVDKLLEEIEKV